MDNAASTESIIDVQPLEPSENGQPPARVPGRLNGGEEHEHPDSGRWIASASLVTSLLWAGGATAFLIGYYGPGQIAQVTPAELAGMGFIVAAPSMVMLVLGAAAREIVKFASTARMIEATARRLSAPVSEAESEARGLADAVSEQIERLTGSAEGALARLGAMEEVLRHHSAAVGAASGDARREVDGLIEDLRKERAAISTLAKELGSEAHKISTTIDRQAELVNSTLERAATQTTEGRSLLNDSAERLAAVATSAQQSGERAAFSIGEQMRDMEALVKVLDERANSLETLARSHQDNLRLAQDTSREMTMAADAGAGAMRSAVDAALDQARRLAETISEETRTLADAGAKEVDRVKRAAEAARSSVESAGTALESNASALLAQVERVKEANVEAAAHTDEVLQSRLRAVERVVSEVDTRLDDLRGRSRAFEHRPPPPQRPREERPPAPPPRARDERRPAPPPPPPPSRDDRRLRDDRRGRDDGLLDDELDRLARLADDRARSRGRGDDRRRPAPEPERRAEYREPPRNEPHDDLRPLAAPRGRRAPEPPPPAHDRDRDRARPDRGYSEPPPRASRAEDLGGGIDGFAPDLVGSDRRAPRRAPPRPRAEREPFDDHTAPLGAGGARDDAENGGWRWKDVLDNIDETPRGEAAGDAVVTGLRGAGVDPAAAVDPDMTARVARVRRRAGSGEARALVLDGALAEVRRVSAALASDSALRDDAEDFLDDYARKVRRAIDENDPRQLVTLLDCDLGRAYMLVDAALADN